MFIHPHLRIGLYYKYTIAHITIFVKGTNTKSSLTYLSIFDICIFAILSMLIFKHINIESTTLAVKVIQVRVYQNSAHHRTPDRFVLVNMDMSR